MAAKRTPLRSRDEREEIEWLRYRVEELEGLLGLADDAIPPKLLGLTPTETRLLALLVKRETLSREFALVAMYDERPGCDRPDERIIDQFIMRVRRKLAPAGIAVQNRWGGSFFITADDKAKLAALIAEARGGLDENRAVEDQSGFALREKCEDPLARAS